MKRLAIAAAALVGIVVGFALPVALWSPQAPAVISPPTTTRTATTALFSVTSAAPVTTASEATPSTRTHTTYLVWSSGGLAPELVARVELSFPRASLVKGDVVGLDAGGGELIPLDAVALSPSRHRPFDTEGELAPLRPGTVALGDTSARLRQAQVGDELILDGVGFTVALIVSDQVIGMAEVAFSSDDPASPVSTDRFLLIESDLPRLELEAGLRAAHPGPGPLRIRAEAETPWLRHGDAVLPQVLLKDQLGEFSYRPRAGSAFEENAEFLDAEIVTAKIPLLGDTRCHRIVVEMLNGAMNQLVDEGLAHLIEPGGFAGCWFPRFINSASGKPAGVSRHAFGAAVDINAGSNPLGSAGTQPPRLIEIMNEWGFAWGGEWLVPDPMHFEFLQVPDRLN